MSHFLFDYRAAERLLRRRVENGMRGEGGGKVDSRTSNTFRSLI